MRRIRVTRWLGLLALLRWLAVGPAVAAEVVTYPYVGVVHVFRTDSLPRPVAIHLMAIDLNAPGLRFRVSPQGGPLDTYKQTTLDFLKAQGAQIAINAHFFEPWPPPVPDPGTADLVGLAASDGDVYSPFEDYPPKPYAIQANAPGLNLDAGNQASIVHRDFTDTTGFRVVEPVGLYNALAGNEQIITHGVDTTPNDSWNRSTYSARTAIGLSADRRVLYLFTVDKAGGSQGLSVYEVAEWLRAPPYAVFDALALDGGGSTTLAMEDPLTGVDATINVPVSGLRAVGSSLAVFASLPAVAVAPGPVARGVAALGPALPNPFGASTRVELTRPRGERVTARVLDIGGRVVKVLSSGQVGCCRLLLAWDGADDRGARVRPGCYILQVVHEDGALFRKLAVVR